MDADEAVYFSDAVHPEYQTKPSYGWVKAGSNPAVTTAAGRGRVNIHGALNFESLDAPFVEPTTADGASAAQLLAKIEARNREKRLIHVICDNAAQMIIFKKCLGAPQTLLPMKYILEAQAIIRIKGEWVNAPIDKANL